MIHVMSYLHVFYYRSVSFHYTTGVTIGIIASLLVLVYIISKLVPGVGVVKMFTLINTHSIIL